MEDGNKSPGLMLMTPQQQAEYTRQQQLKQDKLFDEEIVGILDEPDSDDSYINPQSPVGLVRIGEPDSDDSYYNPQPQVDVIRKAKKKPDLASRKQGNPVTLRDERMLDAIGEEDHQRLSMSPAGSRSKPIVNGHGERRQHNLNYNNGTYADEKDQLLTERDKEIVRLTELLERELEGKDRLVALREREISTLQRRLETTVKEYTEIEADHRNVIRERDRLRKSYNELDRSFEKTVEELECTKKELAAVKESSRQTDEERLLEVERLRMECMSKGQQLKLLEKSLEDKDGSSTRDQEIQALRESYSKQIETLKDEIKSAFELNKKMQKDHCESEKKVRQLKIELDAMAAEKAQEIERLVREKLILEGKKHDCSDAQTQTLPNVEDTLTHELRSKYAELEKRHKALEAAAMKNKSTDDEVASEMESLKEENEKIKKEYLDLSNKYQLSNIKMAAQTKTLSDLQTNHASHCQKELTKRENDIIRLTEELQRKQEELALHSSVVEEIEILREKHLEEMNKLMVQNNQLIAETTLLKNEKQKQQEAVSEFSSEEEINALKAIHKEEIHKYISSVNELNLKAAALTNELQHQQQKIQDLTQRPTVEDFNQLIIAHEKELQKYLSINESLRSENKVISEKVASATRLGDVTTSIEEKPPERVMHDAATLTEEKCYTEHGLQNILFLIARQHEIERKKYDDSIEQLNEALTQNSQRTTRLEEEKKQLLIYASELTKKCNETVAELDRMVEKINSERLMFEEKYSQARSNLEIANAKYNKLKGSAKEYRDHFEKATKKIKEKYEKDKNRWEEDKVTLMKEKAEGERMQRELDLLRDEIQRLLAIHNTPFAVDQLIKLCDNIIEKQPT